MKFKHLSLLSLVILLIGCKGKPDTPTPVSPFPEFPNKFTSFNINLSKEDANTKAQVLLSGQNDISFEDIIIKWGFKNFAYNNVTKTTSNNCINNKEIKMIEWKQNLINFCVDLENKNLLFQHQYCYITTDLNENVKTKNSKTIAFFFDKRKYQDEGRLTYIDYDKKTYTTNMSTYVGQEVVKDFKQSYQYVIENKLKTYESSLKATRYLQSSYIDKVDQYLTKRLGKKDDDNYSLGIEGKNTTNNHSEVVGEKSITITGTYSVDAYHLYSDYLLIDNNVTENYDLISEDKSTYKKESKKEAQTIKVDSIQYKDIDLTGFTEIK